MQSIAINKEEGRAKAEIKGIDLMIENMHRYGMSEEEIEKIRNGG